MAPIEIELKGPNLAILQELGDQYRERLESIPHVTHTSTGLVGGAPKLVFQLQEENLRLANLQLSDVAGALDRGLRGQVGGRVAGGESSVCRCGSGLPEQDWGTPERIADLRVPLAGIPGDRPGRLAGIPLNALGKPSLVPSQSPITRLDGERSNQVKAYLSRGVLPEEALKLLKRDLEENPTELPDGYSFSYGGDTDERAKVVKDIMAPMGLILSALLATLMLTFNSWRLSAVAVLVCICSRGTIPAGAGGLPATPSASRP